MANDRLFLHCPRCGEQYMIGSRLGDSWTTPCNFAEEGLNDFFRKHFGCELGTGRGPWEFELHTEQGPMAVTAKDYQSVP